MSFCWSQRRIFSISLWSQQPQSWQRPCLLGIVRRLHLCWLARRLWDGQWNCHHLLVSAIPKHLKRCSIIITKLNNSIVLLKYSNNISILNKQFIRCTTQYRCRKVYKTGDVDLTSPRYRLRMLRFAMKLDESFFTHFGRRSNVLVCTNSPPHS